MRSAFYYNGAHQEVALKLSEYINALPNFLSERTANSPRSVGDAIESIVADCFENLLGDWCMDYSNDFARRSMADIAFTDKQGIYSVIDVKTHRRDTKFNMPNLTSVRRLSRFYESDHNVFAIVMIKYSIEKTMITVSDVLFCPIEFLDWDCLTIGALGWGQIQIVDSNRIRLIDRYSRKKCMLKLCDEISEFYHKEIGKIYDRIDQFDAIRTFWERKEEIWDA